LSSDKDEEIKEQVTYRFSSDRRALELIFHRLDYATNALIVGDYGNAIENIEAAYENLPNEIKDTFPKPVTAINEAIAKIPTEDQLWHDERFMQSNPGWKDIPRFRKSKATQIIYSIVHDYKDRMIRALDARGLYVGKEQGGLEPFGGYTEATKGMAFEGPKGKGGKDAKATS
jgi:hypothetical protein